MDKKDEWLFPSDQNPREHVSADGLYMDVYRVLRKLGLLERLDPDSKRNQLHPHSFRKYFFSKLIGAGVDRGIAEHFMGHSFGLDNAYLHMDDDLLKMEYMKASDNFTFLQDRKLDRESKERVDELENQLKRKDDAIANLQQRISHISTLSEEEIEAVRQLIAKEH
jgi:hypothetical protein